MNQFKYTKRSLLPLIATAAVIILDQITKALIASNIPEYTVGASFFNDLIRIIHVRNLGVAFSFGGTWPYLARRIIFAIVPLIVMAYVFFQFLFSNSFNNTQRWCIAVVLGGGLGNIIDRIFRPAGVVDFIDIKFFGLFGLDRWPTFNVADMAVVIGVAVLLVSYLIQEKKSSAK